MCDFWASFSRSLGASRLWRCLVLLGSLVCVARPTADIGTPEFVIVNSVFDAVDVNRGDGICASAGGSCTLRAAIQEANTRAAATEISLPAGVFKVTLAGQNELLGATGDLNIGAGKDITINGAGQGLSIIDANALDRAFQSTGGRLILNDVTVRSGNPGSSAGGCFFMGSGSTLIVNRSSVTGCTTGPSGGGGILMFGTSPSTLTLIDSTISGNTTTGAGGGVDIGSGVTGTILRSTISGNTAATGAGLDFFVPSGPSSTLTIANSTISGNTATSGGGGGLFMTGSSASTLTLTNVTIASNSSVGGGAVLNSGSGQIRVRNSVIADNAGPSGQNCSGTNGGALFILGNNLEFPGTGCGFSGTSDRRIPPFLAPLGANGGLTQTHALGIGSPAIDAGDPATCGASPISGLDQRGFLRPSACDIGAYEAGAVAPPTTSLDRSSLNFAAISDGSGFISQTPGQTVHFLPLAGGSVPWTATSNAPWLLVSPASGTGPATLTVSTKFTSGLGASQTGAITFTTGSNLTSAATGNTTGQLGVTLAVVASTAAPSPPFGSFDTPAGDASVLAGSIAVTGWTLDNIGVKQVELWRDLQPGETTPPGNSTPGDPRNGKIFIANATFVDNARPDVEGVNPTIPANYRAGWGYLMLTWGLFGQGNGTYKFYAFGVDQEGNTATIGTKTVLISNNTATKPFGSIDTPGIGGEASGPNFGWGLTPKVNGAATCKIQPSGVQYSIDSGPLQPVAYADARADIAGAFPGFSNTAAAGGHAIIDWSALTNGSHTIGWLITDDCNRADGVGSRFFTVTTGTNVLADPDFRLEAEAAPSAEFRLKAEATPSTEFRLKAETTDVPAIDSVVSADRRNDDAVLLARGYGELPILVEPDQAGSRTIEVKQGERIEIRVPRGFERAYQLGPAGEARALPDGSTWDETRQTFYWQPAPGFLGPFRLVFGSGAERIRVRLIVKPD